MLSVHPDSFFRSDLKGLRLILAATLLSAFPIAVAAASNWQRAGADKDAFGNDMRVIEIDLDSIKRTSSGATVTERVTSHSVGNTGYSCADGDIRHGNTSPTIANLICTRPTSAKSVPHVAQWRTINTSRTHNGEMNTQIDLNSIIRNGASVLVVSMQSDSALQIVEYDCKGYFKSRGGWVTLDITDHTAMSPRGFVSLERKIATKVCSAKTP
jgi:hypothetical protein